MTTRQAGAGTQRLADELTAKTVEIAHLVDVQEILRHEVERANVLYQRCYELLTPTQKKKLAAQPE